MFHFYQNGSQFTPQLPLCSVISCLRASGKKMQEPLSAQFLQILCFAPTHAAQRPEWP